MSSYVNGASIIALSSVLSALGIISVCARFYVRKTYRQGFGWDDWLIVPALLIMIGQAIALIIGAEAKIVGYPTGAVSLDSIDSSLAFVEQIEFAVLVMSTLSLGMVKLSLLCFYRRVFYTGSNRSFDIITKILYGLIIGWTVSLTIAFIFQCGSNIPLQWGDFEDVTLYCVNTEALNLFYVSSDVLIDIFLFVLPIPLVLRLKLSRSRRIAIMIIFCLGALTVVASIIRIVIFSIIYVGIDTTFLGQDVILITSIIFYWTMFEVGLAVIVACLPALQVWVRKANLEAVTRNVGSIFSIQSLLRSSQKSNGQATGDFTEGNESRYTSLSKDQHVELDTLDEYSVQDEENHARHK